MKTNTTYTSQTRRAAARQIAKTDDRRSEARIAYLLGIATKAAHNTPPTR